MRGLKRVAGIWLPAWEERLLPGLADGSVGRRARSRLALAARGWSRRRRAVDVGGHVGLWSRQLARRFDSVIAFEPLALHRACFRRNLGSARVELLPCALGAGRAGVRMSSGADSSAESRVAGPGALPMRRLDDLGLDAVPLDLLTLDCEGYELFVLRGAEQTLLAHRPRVVVERRPGAARRQGASEGAAVEYLTGLGAALREEMETTVVLDWAGTG